MLNFGGAPSTWKWEPLKKRRFLLVSPSFLGAFTVSFREATSGVIHQLLSYQTEQLHSEKVGLKKKGSGWVSGETHTWVASQNCTIMYILCIYLFDHLSFINSSIYLPTYLSFTYLFIYPFLPYLFFIDLFRNLSNYALIFQKDTNRSRGFPYQKTGRPVGFPISPVLDRLKPSRRGWFLEGFSDHKITAKMGYTPED